MRRECRELFPRHRLQRKALASRHVRHPRALMHVGIANPLLREKLSRHSRRMRKPKFYVSGKRLMGSYGPYSGIIWICYTAQDGEKAALLRNLPSYN